MANSVGEVIESLGFGRFSYTIIFITGVLYMGEASELNLVSIISPQLRCSWNLSSVETSALSGTVFAGLAIGNVYWGYLSDKHGRKMFMIIGAFFTVYLGLLSTVVPSYIWLLILRFFVGIALGSVGFGMSYIAEFIRRKDRGKSMICVEFFYAFGSIYVAVISLLLMPASGWRAFLGAATIPPAAFLLLSPWLPESVRYLQHAGNYDEMVKVFHRMSLSNKRPTPPLNFECAPTPTRGNAKMLFGKGYRLKMAIMITYFVAGQCGYYGVVLLGTELLQREDHANTTTSGPVVCHELNDADYMQNLIVVLAELPGILLPALLVDVIGRKGYIIPGFLISGIGFLLLNIRSSRALATALMFVLRALLTGLSQAGYVLAAEMFPTVVRTSALGIFMGVSRVSLIGVPFLVQTVLHVSLMATTLVFGGLCFLTAILVLFLPETKGTLLD